MHVRFNYLTSLIPSPGPPSTGWATRPQPLWGEERTSFPPLVPVLTYARSFSHLHSSKTDISWSFSSLSLSLALSFLLFSMPSGSSFARANSPPRIDHLPDRTLLGIISYVAVAHSRSDMRRIPWREKVWGGKEDDKRERERDTGIRQSESWKNHTYTLHGRY